ncbi:hypothetical protein AMEX_G7377 [Astyanax mexicanus]|uniref:Uncharacterized protein n=1 Tax=Astyanax mexicanus TaxID=7994 RepID=A0A8T2M5Z4_ASTMX|nr:hypothetical protein AMEX_G7377 [Astyanax mexicanus]
MGRNAPNDTFKCFGPDLFKGAMRRTEAESRVGHRRWSWDCVLALLSDRCRPSVHLGSVTVSGLFVNSAGFCLAVCELVHVLVL